MNTCLHIRRFCVCLYVDTHAAQTKSEAQQLESENTALQKKLQDVQSQLLKVHTHTQIHARMHRTWYMYTHAWHKCITHP